MICMFTIASSIVVWKWQFSLKIINACNQIHTGLKPQLPEIRLIFRKLLALKNIILTVWAINNKMTAHSMQCMYTHIYKCTAYIYWAGFQGEECA